jgi:hypothetical protein
MVKKDATRLFEISIIDSFMTIPTLFNIDDIRLSDYKVVLDYKLDYKFSSSKSIGQGF